MNNKCTQKCQNCRCRNNRNQNMNLTNKTGSNRKTATDNQWSSRSEQNQMTDERNNQQSNSENNREFR